MKVGTTSKVSSATATLSSAKSGSEGVDCSSEQLLHLKVISAANIFFIQEQRLFTQWLHHLHSKFHQTPG